MRSFDNIDESVHSLIAHKSEFVFSGDQAILQKVFKSLGIDPSKPRKKKAREDPSNSVSKAIAKLAANIP